MRALGPGSVSSLLKLVLDVISFALWLTVGALVLAALLALLLPADLDIWKQVATRGPRGPMLAAGLLAFTLYVGVVLYIVGRLQRIFTTLTAGDPFHPDNVTRLRAIGFSLAALELINYIVNLVSGWVFPDQFRSDHFPLNPTAWFAVLVVFVLAEVFREGARLRSEAELTI
jgi:hypothetical protein